MAAKWLCVFLSISFLVQNVTKVAAVDCWADSDCKRSHLTSDECKVPQCACKPFFKVHGKVQEPFKYGCRVLPEKPVIQLSTPDFETKNFDIIKGKSVNLFCFSEESEDYEVKWFRDNEIIKCMNTTCRIIALSSASVRNIQCQIIVDKIYKSEKSESLTLNVINIGSTYEIQPVAYPKYFSAQLGSTLELYCGNTPIGAEIKWFDSQDRNINKDIVLKTDTFFDQYYCSVFYDKIHFSKSNSNTTLLLDVSSLLNNLNKSKSLKTSKGVEKYYPKTKSEINEEAIKNSTQFKCSPKIFYKYFDLTDVASLAVTSGMKINIRCECDKTKVKDSKVKYKGRDLFRQSVKAYYPKLKCDSLTESFTIVVEDDLKNLNTTAQKSKLNNVLNYFKTKSDRKLFAYFKNPELKIAPNSNFFLKASNAYLKIVDKFNKENDKFIFIWQFKGETIKRFYDSVLQIGAISEKDLGKYSAIAIPCPGVSYIYYYHEIQNCIRWYNFFPGLSWPVTPFSLQKLTNTIPDPVINSTVIHEFNRINKKITTYIYLSCFCKADSSRMTYIWKKGTTVLKEQTEKNLKLQGITEKDQGKYTCAIQFNNMESKESNSYTVKPIGTVDSASTLHINTFILFLLITIGVYLFPN